MRKFRFTSLDVYLSACMLFLSNLLFFFDFRVVVVRSVVRCGKGRETAYFRLFLLSVFANDFCALQTFGFEQGDEFRAAVFDR